MLAAWAAQCQHNEGEKVQGCSLQACAANPGHEGRKGRVRRERPAEGSRAAMPAALDGLLWTAAAEERALSGSWRRVSVASRLAWIEALQMGAEVKAHTEGLECGLGPNEKEEGK